MYFYGFFILSVLSSILYTAVEILALFVYEVFYTSLHDTGLMTLSLRMTSCRSRLHHKLC